MFLKGTVSRDFQFLFGQKTLSGPHMSFANFLGFANSYPQFQRYVTPNFQMLKKLLLDIDNINKSTLFRQIIPLNSVRYLQISLRSPRSHCPVCVLSTTTWEQVLRIIRENEKFRKKLYCLLKIGPLKLYVLGVKNLVTQCLQGKSFYGCGKPC